MKTSRRRAPDLVRPPLWLVVLLLFVAAGARAAPRVALAQGEPCLLQADLDGSGLVDVQDIALVAERWPGPLDDPRYDLNQDGRIDVVDVMLVAVYWNEAGGEPPRIPGGGQVWAEGSTRKVRLTDSPPATTWVWDGCRVRLSAARNETEPVQLILTAGAQDLTGVNVTVGALTGPGGATIGQDQITLYREAYHTVAQPSDPYGYGLPAGALDPGAILDALIPFRDPYDPGRLVGAPFGVAAGQNQPIWIDLAVPTGTPPGTYEGTITITADQGDLSLPLRLVVWNFTLPSQPSLFVNFTMDPAWVLPPQYGVAEGTVAYYDLIDKHYEALAAHRLGAVNLYRVPAVTEAGGQVQLDWSQTDPLYDHWLDSRGLPGFYVPDLYDGGAERYRIRKTGGEYYTQADFNDPVFVEKARQYYAAVRDHLVARRWWDRAWAYPTDESQWVADEPEHNGPSGFQRLEAWAQLLKDVDPGYRITASSVYPVPVGPPERGWPDLKGLVDDWNVVVQDADLDPALWERRLGLGETLSFYHNDWGDFLDYKATMHRGLGWVAYKHGAWAVSGWAVAVWIGANGADVVNPWTSPVTPQFGYGGGALFWPGSAIEGDAGKNVAGPLPSIRLKLAREAVEDHASLTLLAQQTGPDYVRDLVRGLIPRDYWAWDPPPEAIYARRDRIGWLLDSGEPVSLATIRGQVTDAADGAPVADVLVTGGESAALTDATGSYTLTVDVPPAGTLDLRFSAPRYRTEQRAVAGAEIARDVALTHVAEESLVLSSFEAAGELGEWEFANTLSAGRVSGHATDGSYALKIVFNDDIALAQAGGWPAAGVGSFPTSNWSAYTALGFDVYNESDFYTSFDVSVIDSGGGEYPQTGGTITLLPNQSRHVVILLADVASSGVDLTRIAWLDFAPETITEQEDSQGQTRLWPLGPRTLYLDNLRLVRLVAE